VSFISIKFDPDALYPEGAVLLALDIPSAAIIRARRTGALRYRKIGNRTLYLGRWLRDWLEEASPAASKGLRRG